jgi:hypothetical protein
MIMDLFRAALRVRTSAGEQRGASLAMLRTSRRFTLNILARFFDPSFLHDLIMSLFNLITQNLVAPIVTVEKRRV